MAEYDAIGDRYSEAKTAPWRIHLEAYTLERLAGDVAGAQVLDLASGDGVYSRRLMRRGAAATLGVDASAEMVQLARQAEAVAPLGCRYRVADVNDLGALGAFDVVVAAYLLNYARRRTELRRLCDVMYANLRPGGQVIGANDHTDDGVTGRREFSRHACRKIGPTPYEEGQPITSEFVLPAGRSFAITNYYWSPATYLQVLGETGFATAQWHPFQASPEGRRSCPTDYRDEVRTVKPMAAFRATRATTDP